MVPSGLKLEIKCRTNEALCANPQHTVKFQLCCIADNDEGGSTIQGEEAPLGWGVEN